MKQLEKKLKKALRKAHPEWSNLRVADEAKKLAVVIEARDERKRQSKEGEAQA